MNIKLTIVNKLIGSFALMVLLLLITVYINYRGIQANEKSIQLIKDVRTPTALASYRALTALNQSLAALRGWMLLNDVQFKDQRRDAWQDMETAIDELETLSASFTNLDNVTRVQNIRDNLEKFRSTQQEIEDIANTDSNIPAYNILLTKAAPLASIMSISITEMIDLEKLREASPQRKAILGQMADVRGSLGLGLANIRAYLLTGNANFRSEFDKLWATNSGRFADLSKNYGALNGNQQKAYITFSTARSEFVKYPNQMFDARGSEDWNLANHWLKTKAAPVAAELSTVLNELTANQQELFTIDNQKLMTTNQSMKTNSLIIALVGAALSIIIAYLIIRSVTVPLAKMNENIRSIASGDFTNQIDTSGHDEIAMAMKNMSEMVKKIKSVISSVATSAENIADASSAMSATSQQLSQGTQEQAASAEEISSSMEQMTSNIQQNTENAQQTEKIAMKAAEEIKSGSSAVSQTVESMKKISRKIGIIGEIARQTNLLALNAAVEAARAGEQGKGFAVVASEVRKLAERSQIAADEINSLSFNSVSIANQSGRLLEQIVPNIQNTAKLVQEIAASSLEQNSGADQVNTAIQQFNQVIQQNAASAEEMASSSEELAGQAENLKEIISFFKVNTEYRLHSKSSLAGDDRFSKVVKKSQRAVVKKTNSIHMGEYNKIGNHYENF